MLNDKDMDVLLGRYAKGAAKSTPVEHPDADELNAFAEGALPPAARQRYLSHFADCDDCRKLVSQLAVTTGAGVEARIPASEPMAEPWWRKLGAVFAIPTLRYVASAVVLLAVVGVAFVVWRRPAQQNAEMIAQNQPQSSPLEALQQETSKEPAVVRQETTQSTSNNAVPQPSVPTMADKSQRGLTTVSPPPPPPKTLDAVTAKEAAPVVAGAARADDAPRAQSSPSYAPAPAAEGYSVYDRSREQQPRVGASPGGPRRNESYDKSKTADRTGDFAKGRDEDSNRAVASRPATQNKVEDSKRTSPDVAAADVSRRGVQELRVEARKSERGGAAPGEAPETRSVGGRKFRRQGKAWVDAKFKSSMSTRTVARGSEEFDKLDSGLRSIANQLGGEIVVVWKGKAYRIR